MSAGIATARLVRAGAGEMGSSVIDTDSERAMHIVVSRTTAAGRLTTGMRLLLVGYSVGLSWGACVVRW